MLLSTIKINKMNILEYPKIEEIDLRGNFKPEILEQRLKLISSLKKFSILINSILENKDEELILNSQTFKEFTGKKYNLSIKFSEYYFANSKKNLLKEVIWNSVPVFKDLVLVLDKDLNHEKGLFYLSFKNTCKKNSLILETNFYETKLSKENKEKLIEDYLFIKSSLLRNEKNLKKISIALKLFLETNQALNQSLENFELKSFEDLNLILLELKNLRKIYGTN